MASPQRARYFIIHDNAMIPLIPHDELGFCLSGWPRQLTYHQINKEGWKLAGDAQGTPSVLSDQASAASRTQPVPPAKITKFSLNHKASKFPITAVSEPQRSVTLGDTEPCSAKKEYCDFWMRTGECNFADFTKSEEGVGCIYKHEMPTDLVHLRKLGFPHGVPRWYKEKTAGGLNRSQRHIAQGDVDRRMSKEPLASRTFHYPASSNERNESNDMLQDLIDLSDSPISTSASYPQTSVSPSSSVASLHANILGVSPSKLLPRTMASQLRFEQEARKTNENDPQAVSESPLINNSFVSSELKGKQETRQIEMKTVEPKNHTLLINKSPYAPEGQRHLITSLSKTTPQTKAPDLEPGHQTQKVKKTVSEPKMAIQPITRSSMGFSNERQTESSKLHPACKSRPQKFTERIITLGPQGGLASSKHATGNQAKWADNSNRGGKRHGTKVNSMDL